MGLISNIPSPKISVALSPHNERPLGVMSIALGKNVGVSNCWITSSIALLANDPLISSFVDFACGRDGVRFYDPECTNPAMTVQFTCLMAKMGATVEDKRRIVDSLLMNLWLVNHGSNTLEGRAIRKRNATILFELTATKIAPDIPDDGYAGFVDALYVYKDIIAAAMKAWWNQYSSDLYANYGHAIHAKTLHFDIHNNATCMIDTSAAIASALDVQLLGRKFVHLNHEITRVFFNHARLKEEPNRELLRRNPLIITSAEVVCIDTLPLRFSINIHRVSGILEHGRFDAASVVYNPRSFILGPTLGCNLYARYRLVGRIVHTGAAHYTSNILHPKRRNEPYDPDTCNSKPEDMIKYDFDRASIESFGTNHDAKTGLLSDTHGVLLEFEKYQG